MRFRYKDKRGKIVSLPDVAALLWAIREGNVLAETQLAVGEEKTFARAALVVAYQQAAVAVGRAGGNAVAAARVRLPWHTRKSFRIGAGVAAAVAVVSIMGMRIRSIGQEHARQYAVVAPVGPAPSAKDAIGRLSEEFGDSAALFQHRLETWVARQNFGNAFKGGGLRAPSALRATRAAAGRYKFQVDSMLDRSRGLAVSLVRRADSAESATTTLDGLMASVEDAMVDWQRELTVYADLERAAAATIDSLAGFVLGRQQSFAVREGKPVFLSRTDAARYRELAGGLELIAKREKAWADALLERRPEWMTRIPETDRPRFGRVVLSGPASN